MARRVKQADGKYCYTENCRIHDRALYDSTGLQAVQADLKEAHRENFTDIAADSLKEKLGSQISEELREEIANKVLDEAANDESGFLPQTIAESLNRTAGERYISLSPMDCIETAHDMFTKMDQSGIINRGDEVILNETGERGTISEGSTRFAGTVRFNPEDIHSRNSFAWFQHKDVTKVAVGKNALAREQIVAAPRDAVIPVATVRTLIEQETSPKTRNAQAAREFTKKNGKFARETLREFGDTLVSHYEGKALTKQHIVKLLNAEYNRPVEGMSAEQVRDVKAGLRGIITYLERVK